MSTFVAASAPEIKRPTLWCAPVTIGAITVLALALRLYRLDAESLYMDEIVTVETFHRDPAGVVAAAATEGQPPLDNFLGAVVYRLGLGQSDWWVRFPAAVFGAGSVLLLGIWVRRLASDFAALVAAFLLAVCPLHVYMSQEVRPYALMFFLALACGLCYVRAREWNRRRDWALYATVAFAMLMTRWTDPHFVVMGIGLHALSCRVQAGPADEREKSVFHGAWVATVAAYVCYAPFFWIVLQYQKVSIKAPGHDWLAGFTSLLYEAFAALFAGYSTRTIFVALPGSRWLIVMGITLMAVGLFVVVLRRASRGGVSSFWWIFLPFPVVYALVYALLGNAVPKPQYLLLMAMPVLACIAVGLDAIRNRFSIPLLRQATVALGLLVFAAPMTLRSWEGLQRLDKRDWRGAMGFLKQNSRPGDAAVCLGSDTIPPTFRPKAYGKERYGPPHLKFIPVSADTRMSAFDDPGWQAKHSTVWMLVYKDRMYTGVDQVPPPSVGGHVIAVHDFHGLFIVEVRGQARAVDRLMAAIGGWYQHLPHGRSFAAPALLRWRFALSQGDSLAAAESLTAARRQCSTPSELSALSRITHSVESLVQSRP